MLELMTTFCAVLFRMNQSMQLNHHSHFLNISVRLCFPDMSDIENAPYYLERYLREDKHFEPGVLKVLTDGMSATATFRRVLKHFLTFSTLSPDIKSPMLSFIDTVRFWDDFKSTVNIHHEGKPLFVKGFNAKYRKLLKDNRELINRQIIVIK